MRNKAWRNAQRERIIRKRLGIINNIWISTYSPVSGKLDKGNLTCHPKCGMCKPWKRGLVTIEPKLLRKMQRSSQDWVDD